MKRTIAIFLIVAQACNGGLDETNGLPVVVGLYYQKGGVDLLNPSSPTHYSFDNINLYDYGDGMKRLLYNANLLSPKYCSLIDSAGQYHLIVYPQNDLTLIQLDQTTVDTLSYLVTGSKIQIWYNSTLVVKNGRPLNLFSIKVAK